MGDGRWACKDGLIKLKHFLFVEVEDSFIQTILQTTLPIFQRLFITMSIETSSAIVVEPVESVEYVDESVEYVDESAEYVESGPAYLYNLHDDSGREYAMYRDADGHEYVELPDLTVDFRVPRGLNLPPDLTELLVQYIPYEPVYSDHYVPYVAPSLYCLMDELRDIENLYEKALELAEYYVSKGKPDIIYISSCFVDALYGKRLSLICEIERRTNRNRPEDSLLA